MRSLFLAIRRNEPASPFFSREIVGWWIVNGDSVRSEVCDDLLVLDALKKLLPQYTGPGIRLYRGESRSNRQRRTYGMSWSSNLKAARYFANDREKSYLDGTCILEAEVAPEAIISCIHEFDPENGEFEYLVDRRRLGRVRVVESPA